MEGVLSLLASYVPVNTVYLFIYLFIYDSVTDALSISDCRTSDNKANNKFVIVCLGQLRS